MVFMPINISCSTDGNDSKIYALYSHFYYKIAVVKISLEFSLTALPFQSFSWCPFACLFVKHASQFSLRMGWWHPLEGPEDLGKSVVTCNFRFVAGKGTGL